MDLINKILFCFPSTSNKTFTYYYRFLCGVLYRDRQTHTQCGHLGVSSRPTFAPYISRICHLQELMS